MASELRVNTLKDAAGNNSIATSFVANGSAKVWAKATQADNSVYDSLNLTSITDDGTGQLTFTIANNMANVNYGFTSTTQVTDCGGLNEAGTTATTTGTAEHQGRNSSGTNTDSNPVTIVIVGDLA
jgi:hypothetical protein